MLNYNHDTRAPQHLYLSIASFKCITWRMFRVYNLAFIFIFAIFELWLIQH